MSSWDTSTNTRSAPGAKPGTPEPAPFPAQMSSTWVPCAPLDERVSRAGPYPRARYGSGCFSAALISSGVYSRPYPKRALRRGHATLVPDGKQARPARGGHEVAVGEVAAVI